MVQKDQVEGCAGLVFLDYVHVWQCLYGAFPKICEMFAFRRFPEISFSCPETNCRFVGVGLQAMLASRQPWVAIKLQVSCGEVKPCLRAVRSALIFSGRPQDFYGKVAALIHEHGGKIDGGPSGGAFSISVPVVGSFAGKYSIVGQTCTVSISSKPFLISCDVIEAVTRKYAPT